MKQTVGQTLSDLTARQLDKISVTEAWKRKEDDYLKQLIDCAEKNRKVFDGDFFIVTTLKHEKILSTALPTFREYFIAQQSCPTPNYDQNLYHFDSKQEQIKYIWSIPDRETCHYLIENRSIVDGSERQLLEFVLKFADGTLFTLMKQLNGEKYDSPLLEEK